MLDVKKLSGEELFVIREGLMNSNFFNVPRFIEAYEYLKNEVDKEWTERTLHI